MKTEIKVYSLPPNELPFLGDVLAKIGEYPYAAVAEVYCRERTPATAEAYLHPGWIEWLVAIRFGDSALTLGAIQRHVGAKSEFHS